MSASEHRISDAELAQAVDASYGRLVRGASAPAGSVTIHATDPEEWRRQWSALFDDGEDEGDTAGHVRASGPEADPGAGAP
ncbi:hypothetical protein ACQEU5_20375 [Marinactinospora thermotolerans]|uniref:hypothetical protein n=1 Tax=Marinactinospora thermotolerans TaxID=531310 RepID=UPI000999B111|nr:hypothetical protein [Marinactinospora thermotolerans]